MFPLPLSVIPRAESLYKTLFSLRPKSGTSNKLTCFNVLCTLCVRRKLSPFFVDDDTMYDVFLGMYYMYRPEFRIRSGTERIGIKRRDQTIARYEQ